MDSQPNIDTSVGFSKEGIYELRDRKYQEYSKVYKPCFEKNPSVKVEVKHTPELDKSLQYLDPAIVGKICAFSEQVAGNIPQELLVKEPISNKIQLKALVANSYNKSKQQGESIDEDMYVRTLYALSTSVEFSNDRYVSTVEVTDDFLSDDYEGGLTKGDLTTLFARLTAVTMPVTDSNGKANEKQSKFDLFSARVVEYTDKANKVLDSYIRKFAPDSKLKLKSEPPVFVGDILRGHPLTNDENMEARRDYNNLSAGAITAGLDSVTGLSLSFNKPPYNWDKPQGEFRYQIDDPAYLEASNKLHETIHNVSKEGGKGGDFEKILLELLTDTSTSIVMVESQGFEFLDKANYGAFPEDGYVSLIRFGTDMVRMGLVSKEDVLRFGLQQDPEGFLNFLDAKIENFENVDQVLESMLRRRLILPLKGAERAAKAQELRQSPKEFIQAEFTQAWRVLKGNYFGQPMYLLGLKEQIDKRDPGYSQRMLDRFQIENPDPTLNLDSARLIFDPKDMIYTDEIVDIFRDMYFSQEEKFIPGGLLWGKDLQNHTKMYVEGNNNKFAFIPDSQLVDVLAGVNTILGQRLNYNEKPASEEEKFSMLVDTTFQIYRELREVLKRNWTDHGISYTNSDIVKIIVEVLPERRPLAYNNEARRNIVRDCIQIVDALTSEIEVDSEFKVVPGPSQVHYYGPGAQTHVVA